MLILILMGLTVAGLAIADVVILVPLSFLQWLEPPMWLTAVVALGLLSWLMRE